MVKYRFNIKNKKAFTLVEILVAVALFTLVASIALGSILTIFDANRKNRYSKTVVDNLNLSIENMARTVRFGNNYHCGSTGPLSSPQDCANNYTGDSFLAVTFDGSVIAYRLNGTAIQRSENGGSTYTNITASDVTIEDLRFRVFDSSPSDNEQPYIIVVIKGYVGSKPTLQSKFSITTLMSQRRLDI